MPDFDPRMTEQFDDEPFDRIYQVLSNLENEEPEINRIGTNTREDTESEFIRTIKKTQNYLEQVRMFLKGAEHYDSVNSFHLAEDSLERLPQQLQILYRAYEDKLENIDNPFDDIYNEKDRVKKSLTGDPDKITERENKYVLMDTSTIGNSRLVEPKNSTTRDYPLYIPTGWKD